MDVEASADGDAVAGRLQHGDARRVVIDSGDVRLIDRRERVRRADGQRSNVAAAEREAEEERREKARCEATSVGSKQNREQTRRS